jgi:signal transduction histidine kinase
MSSNALLYRTVPVPAPLRPGRIGLIAIYLVFLAVVARTLASDETAQLLPWYLGLELVYLLLFTLKFLVPDLPGWLTHAYFLFQSALVWLILSLNPEFDFVVLFFFLLGYQASLFLAGRMRWVWVFGLAFLIGASLIFYLGFLRGLGLGLTTTAATIIFPAYLISNYETEMARARSQVLLRELEGKHQQLQAYANQVEELAGLQERNRLARELHDKVSQLLFGISLATRSAQLLLEKDPAKVSEQLRLLEELTADALSQLRSFITQLRPPPASGTSLASPTTSDVIPVPEK